jgi:16S rRNA (cytosine967-C5)-methyltransferase
MSNSRQLALHALRSVHQGAFADMALNQVLSKTELSEVDRRLTTELVYGSIRRQRTLDALIDQLATRKAHQQPPDLRLILHLGLYQLRFLSHIPPAAAVDTTVELAKQNRLAGLAGLVNGLMRQYLRLAEQQGDPLVLSTDPVQRLGMLHSYPDWIVEVWQSQIGLSQTALLCEWMNQPPRLDLRVNVLQTSLAKVACSLEAAGIAVKPIPGLPQALRIMGHPGPIQQLPGFQEGWWVVQESSAQLVSHLLDPQPGEVIADACAAPGGKTTHLAELMADQGTIWACDRTASRLKRLRENIQRLRLQSIHICEGDSRDLPQFIQSCDRVLLDAPCSGLGTLHRHADARWRQTPETVTELAKLQRELLESAASWVKPEGYLVYATCTLHPAENEQVILNFLDHHPEWAVQHPTDNTLLLSLASPEGWLKVWPHQQNMDGFFMVKLQRLRLE